MKILITGGNGYLAKNITKNLCSKYSITSPGKNELDLTNSKSVDHFFRDKYFDVVIHTAIKGASTPRDPDETISFWNLIMFYNLISKKDHFNKLINIGSGAEKYLLETPYGYSKNIINKLVHKYDNFYTLRIYGVFSEDELDTRFIKSNIKRYLNNEPIIIHQNKQMDFFYMKDLVLLIDYYILNSNPPKEIDCTYPESKTLYDIADIINHLDKYKVNIKLEKNDLDKNYTGNFTDISLSYKGIVTGIIETYNQLKNEY